jgi:hypothetical protein
VQSIFVKTSFGHSKAKRESRRPLQSFIPGTDVQILKVFSPPKMAKRLVFFTQTLQNNANIGS